MTLLSIFHLSDNHAGYDRCRTPGRLFTYCVFLAYLLRKRYLAVSVHIGPVVDCSSIASQPAPGAESRPRG